LERQIDISIKKFNGNPVFIRISSTSPKDSLMKNQREKLKQQLIEELKKATEDDEQGELAAINRACLNISQVYSGKQAIDLLSTSDRIYESLFSKLLLKTSFKVNIIVREWKQITELFEFRGFVNNNKLTALTHYFKFCYAKEIEARALELEEKIKTFFNKEIANKLKEIEPYTIDFALLGNKIIVVELNAFGEKINAGLFDWNKDLEVLTGNSTFEFRYANVNIPIPREKLPITLQIILDEIKPPLKKETQATISKQLSIKGNLENCIVM